MHPLLKLFCNNSSLRGVGKIARHKGLLRVVWISYVIGMLILMIYAIVMLFKEYIGSVTSLMTRVIFDIPLEFPAITICYYKPFSWRAESFWKSKNVTTPDDFNANIRETSLRFLNKGLTNIAVQIFDYDQMRLYYQNLKPDEADRISYSEDDMFLFCVVMYVKSQYRKGSLSHCKLKLTKVSMAEYFNCYTVKAMDENISRQMVSLTLILKFNTSASSNYTDHAFIQNVFEQSHGARIQIHEPNTLPQMSAADTISISKGTLSEINYWVGQREEVEESSEHCTADPDDISDMGKTYQYTHDACVENEMNKYYINNCKCMMAISPRPVVPNENVSYCGKIDFENLSSFIYRLKCLQKLQNTENENGALKMKQMFRQETCQRPCSELTYGLHLSTSKWSPDFYKMEQAMRLTNAWDVIRDKSYPKDSVEKRDASFEILNYLTAESFEKQNYKFQNNDESPFSCIKLQRINFDLVHSKDHFILSFNGFISRLGGLCSLTLGLTCIFFVEIIEYIYLAANSIINKNANSTETEAKPEVKTFNELSNFIQYTNYAQINSNTQQQREQFV